uniref:Protection of telomeres protein 1 n=1 Tax=Sinocyclocheilus rhinocerous TaxID=307959 RepID=A0A673NJ32_9TELE
MPVQKVNVSSDLDAKVPSHLQRTSIISLTMTSDPSHRCVKARMVQKGPVISCAQKDGIEMLRAEIREEDPLQRTAEHTSINIIFFGTLAKDFSQSARQGDVVLLADFTIKKSPSFLRDKLHPCQLDMESEDACVYAPSLIIKVTSISLIVGDIIRLHRFKAEMFRDSMSLLNTFGWSTVTFDGTIDNPVVPRTSSKSFHFGESDNRTVQELRRWAANQSWISNDLTVSLSSVKPGMYFDLTCQLLAKAVMDSRCILLKVWDGTKCQHPLLNVDGTLIKYDLCKHPGMFLRFYNLHALVQRAPDQVPDKPEHLSFHLHGGTSYGRGLRSLPAESPDLQSLKSVLEKHVDLDECDDVNDGTLLEIWYTPPEALVLPNDEETVRTCEHNTRRLTLARVKRTTPPLSCHVRARLKKYKPQQLYQCLKLFCFNCKTMKYVPDDSAVAKVFRESVKDNQPCDEQWAATSSASSREPGRTISMHISRDMVGESTHMQLIFVEGTMLDEICMLSRHYKNLVPVRSVNGRMTLLDLTAPFLFSGDKRYYGCKQCSLNTFQNPVFTAVEIWDEQAVAEALGVQLMQFRLLIQFDLEDHTDTLEALLWENAERFFHVSAVDASGSQDLQDKIQTIMDTIQPPYSSLEERPWLDLCLSVYPVKDNDRNKVCYQITNTEIREE